MIPSHVMIEDTPFQPSESHAKNLTTFSWILQTLNDERFQSLAE
jgi:hypothetical protein